MNEPKLSLDAEAVAVRWVMAAAMVALVVVAATCTIDRASVRTSDRAFCVAVGDDVCQRLRCLAVLNDEIDPAPVCSAPPRAAAPSFEELYPSDEPAKRKGRP